MNEDTSPAIKTNIDNITRNMCDYLGNRFPIACANDEFIYFPQVSLDQINPNKWDELSPDAIAETSVESEPIENIDEVTVSTPVEDDIDSVVETVVED